MKLKNLLELKNKKVYVILSGIIIFVLLVLFGPLSYADNFAENQYQNADAAKTVKQNQSFCPNIWKPEYAIFNIDENQSARVNFVQLQRKYLVWWRVSDESSQEISTPENLNENQRSNFAEENLQELHQAVDRGELESGSTANYLELYKWARQAVADAEEEQRPGKVQQELLSPDGNWQVQLALGLNPNENEILLNGEKTGIKNVVETHFDLSGNYLYYSNYFIKENGELAPSGRIFRLDLKSRTEQQIHDFMKNEYVSFRANDKISAYVFQDGSIGVLDLDKFTTRLVGKIEVDQQKAADVELILIRVIDIGPEVAFIETEDRFYTLNLETFKLN